MMMWRGLDLFEGRYVEDMNKTTGRAPPIVGKGIASNATIQTATEVGKT
jgi:hypothetical protein